MKHIVLGTIQNLTGSDGIGRNRFVPNSVDFLHQGLRAFSVGTKMKVTYEDVKRKHTRPQHNYHFALCNLMAQHAGYTPEEMHDVMMKLTFGVRHITIMGRKFEARESLSDSANFTNHQAQDLIQKDLEVCAELGVHVPTMEELGLISNH